MSEGIPADPEAAHWEHVGTLPFLCTPLPSRMLSIALSARAPVNWTDLGSHGSSPRTSYSCGEVPSPQRGQGSVLSQDEEGLGFLCCLQKCSRLNSEDERSDLTALALGNITFQLQFANLAASSPE